MPPQNWGHGSSYKWGQIADLSILQDWRAKRKVRDIIVHKLQFADDCELVAQSLEDLQEITSHFVSAAKDFRLTIGLKKTEVWYQLAPGSSYVDPAVLIDDTLLNPVTKFCYLGSIMSSSASLDLEVESRNRIASFVFGQLKIMSGHRKPGWPPNARYTELLSYQLCCMDVRCGVCIRHLCQIDQIQQHHLHTLMKVTWQDKVPTLRSFPKLECQQFQPWCC